MKPRSARAIADGVANLIQPLEGHLRDQTTDMDLPYVHVQPPSAGALAAARAAHAEEIETLAESLACFDFENSRAIENLCRRTIERIGRRFTELGVVAFPRRAAPQSE